MTHPELSGPPRSKFLKLQAVALTIKSSSGLTPSRNSKVVKDTTGEGLISASLQLGSKCRIRSSGWTSGAQLELNWEHQHPVPDALCWTLQWFSAGRFWEGTGWAMHWLRKNIYVFWKGFPVRDGGCLHVQPRRLTPHQDSKVHRAQDIIKRVPAQSYKAGPWVTTNSECCAKKSNR